MPAMTADETAELSVIGACLVRQEALDQALETLTPESFSTGKHRVIFQALQTTTRADPAICLSEIKRAGVANMVGGIKELLEMAQYGAFSHDLPQHLDNLKACQIRRDLLRTSQEIGSLVKSVEDVAELCGQAEALVYKVSEGGMTGMIVPAWEVAIERMASYDKPQRVGVATGYPALDSMLGGLQPAELAVLAARPSMGKTALALCMALNAAKAGSKVLIYSLEMSREALVDRLICNISGVNSQVYRQRGLAEPLQRRTRDAAGEITDLSLWIDDSSRLTVAEMRSKARRLQRTEGLDLVIIDYLTLISGARRGKMSTNDAVGEVARELKQMAKELNIPVLVLSQLSRSVESRERKHPQLSDLRDSGEIEQVADVVLFIYRADYYERDSQKLTGQAEIIVAKQRNGPIGTIRLDYDQGCNRFTAPGLQAQAKGVFGGVEGRTG